MTDRSKRIFVLIGFLLLVILIALAIYFVFFRTPAPTTNTTPPSVQTPSNTQTGLPSSPAGTPTTGTTTTTPPPSTVANGGPTKTTQLTASAVTAPILSSDGKGVSYYDPSDGRFYTIDANGNVKRLSDQQFPNAQTISWDGGANEVAIEFPDGSNVIYNFDSQKQTTLPAHWTNFTFSPDGTQVEAKSLPTDPNSRALVITNADGSNTQVVAGLGDNADKVQVSWSPNNQVIAFSETGSAQSGLGRSMVLPIGKNDENFKGLIVEGLNFHALWSPDGSQVLYDVTTASGTYEPTLWIVDGTAQTMGNDRRSLGLNTWVDKCTFVDNSTLYCAVPILLPTGAGLQPGLNTSNDSVYKVDVTSGRASFVGYPAKSTQMSNLRVSTDGSKLFFTDSAGRIQEMRLK